MRVILLMPFLLFTFFVNAQTVNIESYRMHHDTNDFFGNIDATFAFNKNQKSIMQLGLNSNLEYEKNRNTFMLISIYSWVNTKENGVKDSYLNEGFEHLRYMYKFAPRFRLENFFQYQFNMVMNLKQRELLGSVIRYKIIDDSTFRAYIGSGFMLENNKIHDPVLNKYETFQYFKSSSYLTTSVYIGKMRLSNTTYFQFNLENYKYRVYSVLESTINIYKHIYYKLSFVIQYDNDPRYKAPTNLTFSTNNRISFTF